MSILLCFSFVFQEWGRSRSQVKLCQLWATLIIEEGRRGENGCCNIHMSYWLDCQLLAHAHSTYEAPQMTEDAMLRPPPASSYTSFSSLYISFLRSIYPCANLLFPTPVLALPSFFLPFKFFWNFFFLLLICCHFSEEGFMPMGQIQLQTKLKRCISTSRTDKRTHMHQTCRRVLAPDSNCALCITHNTSQILFSITMTSDCVLSFTIVAATQSNQAQDAV